MTYKFFVTMPNHEGHQISVLLNENSSSTQARWQGHVMTVHTFSNLPPFKTAVNHVCHFCYFIGVTWLLCVVKTAG